MSTTRRTSNVAPPPSRRTVPATAPRPAAPAPIPRFFATPRELRRWFAAHHADAGELWIGFWKKGVERPSVSYDEAVEEALCFGWIDGIVRRVDEASYMHRFSPRTARSPWSRLNLARARRLLAEGRMHPAGRAALERRAPRPGGTYSYERRPRELDDAALRRLRADPAGWAFYRQQPPGYRRTVAYWVLSAKRPETRERRLGVVLDASRRGRRIDLLAPG